MAFTEVRLTLGAFIQALEKDLKVLINQYITPFQSSIDFFQDKHLQERVLERIKKDEETFAEGASIEELVDYLDFGDTFVILRKNKLFLPERLARFLDQNIIHFNAIIPIRNRVMHTRPLLNGDFNTVYDFISTLESNDTTHWRSIVRTRTEINKDPNSVLTLTIPALELLEDSSPVQHNLPIPDFDETGFIGREDDVRAIIQLISSTPVVTILGDGGIGKSALCLKVAYDLVDLKDQCPFELVIWTTAKSTMLTSQGIQEISSAIKNYAGLVEDISKTLEIESADENQLDEILEYLETFKVLLIIDNLETIHSNEVRDFIRKAQTKCKILITSRIRMGELEYPRRLDGLTSNECARLVRSMAKTRNSDILKKLPNSVLAEVSQQLYFNPLALKWFVNSVENGVPPNEVLLHRDDLLNFCLTNVYDKLSEDARVVLNVIRASRRKMSVGEIIFLSQMRPILIKTLLVELMKTTLIHRHIKDIKSFKEIQYSISDFAKDFLSRNYRIDTDYIRMIVSRYKMLEDSLRYDDRRSTDIFDVNFVSYSTKNQKVASRFLRDALIASRNQDYNSAISKINEALEIDPTFPEVYRVSGFIKATLGDILEAEQDYKTGLEVDKNNVKILFFYSQFLLFELNDIDKAKIYAARLAAAMPDHPTPLILTARCNVKSFEFDKAILILNELYSKTELSSIHKAIVVTELIDCYAAFGQYSLHITNNYELGIDKYRTALELYDNYVSEENPDTKMNKKFVSVLYRMIKDIPKEYVDQTKGYVQEIFGKYEKIIGDSGISTKIVNKYAVRFCDASFDYLLRINMNDKRKIGHVTQKKSQVQYVFIDTGEDRYFAHRNSFININDDTQWDAVSNGQDVAFELGMNSKGECAVNVTKA